jgi:hypothetical protein
MVIRSRIVKMNRAKRPHEADEKCIESFSQTTSQKSHLTDLFIDGGIIIKLILQKYSVTMRAEFIWLRKEFCGYQPLEQLSARSLLARVKFLASKIVVPQINPY